MAQPTAAPTKPPAPPKFEDTLKRVQESFKAVNEEDLKTLVETAPKDLRFQAEQLKLSLYWLGQFG